MRDNVISLERFKQAAEQESLNKRKEMIEAVLFGSLSHVMRELRDNIADYETVLRLLGWISMCKYPAEYTEVARIEQNITPYWKEHIDEWCEELVNELKNNAEKFKAFEHLLAVSPCIVQLKALDTDRR